MLTQYAVFKWIEIPQYVWSHSVVHQSKLKKIHTQVEGKIRISTVGLGIYRTMVITCCGCVSPSSVQSYELWHWPFIIHGLYIDLLHYFDFKVDSL